MNARFVILTWHSIHVLDNTPAGNDLVAFSESLDLLDRQGWTLLPMAEALHRLDSGRLPDKAAVLTVDDGSLLDFHDFEHPTCGHQRSVLHRLADFIDAQPRQSRHRAHVTSFVIASPDARAELDRSDYMGLGVWPDDWWRAANESGRMSVENHSWDHNHASLACTVQRDNLRGDFRFIDSEPECRLEVDRASDYIEARAGRRPNFFAYPYGQASDYLRHEYLPRFGPAMGLQAAFGCESQPVTKASDRWFLPRFMCGADWKSTAELEKLLRAC